MFAHSENRKVAEYLDKIFSPTILLALNATIIAVILIFGGENFFKEIGIIHMLAVFFVVLAILRSFFHYYSHDPILEKFIHGSALAFFIFSISHLFEFLAEHIFELNDNLIAINVAYLYILGLVVMIIGADLVIYNVRKNNLKEIAVFGLLAAISTIIIALSFTSAARLFLELDLLMLAIHLIIPATIGALAFARVASIGRALPYINNFVFYNKIAIVLIVCSILLEISHEKAQSFGIPEEPISYAGHMIFYAALSVVFLSFRAIASPKGIYENIAE